MHTLLDTMFAKLEDLATTAPAKEMYEILSGDMDSWPEKLSAWSDQWDRIRPFYDGEHLAHACWFVARAVLRNA